MKRELNIAVFGLSFNWLDQIKAQILQSMPSNVTVNFVNLAEQNIDALFVNDAFFNASSIQKILAGRVQKYLRLVKNPEHTGEIVNDTLFYPFKKLEYLTHWIEENLLGKSQPKKFPVDMGAIQPAHAKPETFIKELFTPRNGFIQLRDETGFVALVDTRTERIWLNPTNKTRQLHDGLTYTYATSHLVQEVLKTSAAQDLRVWLWHMMQHHETQPSASIKANQYFKLEIWPQFDRGFERRELLKMAACFSKGAKIEDVQKGLNILPERVHRFVAKIELLGMGQFIPATDAKFVVAEYFSEEQGVLKGFFGKLRRKLGL